MLVKTLEITSKCSNFKLNNEPAQILDCVTSMVYKCIDNEKLFSFFSSIFMGNRSIIGMKKKNQSFWFHS